MTDTEILDWMQQNVTMIHKNTGKRMMVTWLDKSGIPQTTEGDNLRDCIRGAVVDSSSRKDAPTVRTLGDLAARSY